MTHCPAWPSTRGRSLAPERAGRKRQPPADKIAETGMAAQRSLAAADCGGSRRRYGEREWKRRAGSVLAGSSAQGSILIASNSSSRGTDTVR